MTTALHRSRSATAARRHATVPHRFARLGLLRELDRPADLFANITPNWYASVMGTGIVAVAAASLPVQFAGLRRFAVGMWVVACVLLVLITAATAVHWVRHRAIARTHHLHPVMSHFYGAAPMALLTVGAATLLVGRDVIGQRAAVDVDWVLWFAGTVSGLITAVAIPLLMLRKHAFGPDAAFGGWLMPIVPPTVSATTGGLLVPDAGGEESALLVCCCVMLTMSVVASAIVIAQICRRLATRDVGESRMVPTLWIVLGPLGQSITAANVLGGNAALAFPAPTARVLADVGLVYGLAVWGLAATWVCVAAAITLRALLDGMPFSLTWWSFTFPVGTCVTGTTQLALHTGAAFFEYAAVAGFAGLVFAWLIVAVRTVRGSVRGELFLRAPAPA